METFDLFGWAGGALLVGRLIPQILHIRRHGDSGISRAGLWCWAGNDLAWLAHGLRQDLDPLTASSAALLLLDLVLLHQTRHSSSRNQTAGILWAASMTAAATAAPQLLPAALAAASVAGTLPHALESLRSSDLSGISATTWKLALLDGILWSAYGIAENDRPVTLYAVLTLATSSIILARLRQQRPDRRQNRTTAAAEAADRS